MLSTFHGIELGKKSLMAQQAALGTTGHNLANQSNSEYSRQIATLSTTNPLYYPALNRAETSGQIGSGVHVSDVSRVRDGFIDDRIMAEQQRLGYWESREFYLKQVEEIHNEPSTPSLKTAFEEFVGSWNNLANNPTTSGAREAVREQGIALTDNINMMYRQFNELRENADSRLKDKVDEINIISKQVADITSEIRKVKAAGDNPNDLMDKRDTMVEKLSKLVDSSVYRDGLDEFIVYIGGEVLVQGGTNRELGVRENRTGEDKVELYWVDNKKDPYSPANREAQVRGGEIKGLIEVRDDVIKGQIRMLDNFSVNLIRTVNDVHKDGFGLNFNTGNSFFYEHPMTQNPNGTHDFGGTGAINGTAIFKISGTTTLSPDLTVGIEGKINLGKDNKGLDINVDYYRTDTVRDVIDKINKSGADVIAYLDHKNRLSIKAAAPNDMTKDPFYIKHLEDSGKFLTTFAGILSQSGNTGAFDVKDPSAFTRFSAPSNNVAVTPFYHPSSWISIDESILKSPLNIAASTGIDKSGDGIADKTSGSGDGTNALRIVASLSSDNDRNGLDVLDKIDTQPAMLDQTNRSFGIYLDKITEETGIKTRAAVRSVEKETQILSSLHNKREAYSGVNIDEELTNMIKYQHGYQAAARMVSVMDQMVDIIINKLGA